MPSSSSSSSEDFEIAGSEFLFRISAKSSNPEFDYQLGDNYEDYIVPISVETKISLTGKSDPLVVQYDSYPYPLSDKYEFEEDIGEEVLHIYDLKNSGTSTINEAEVYILWPSYDRHRGDHLLYLMGLESDRNIARCQTDKAKNVIE